MIYCVEDDDSIRELIVYALNASGFQAKGFEEGQAFWAAFQNESPDLIILDIMLPGESGTAILKKIRQNSIPECIPVIMATAKGTEYDKVFGLDAGADDYLVKPFGMMEMVSRVKAVLRRTKTTDTNKVLSHGNIIMDQKLHQVTSAGKNVELTLKEYELLKVFLENPNRVMTRDQLLLNVWGSDYLGESRTIDVHVGTLRTKLRNEGSMIRTVRGVGYKMEALG